MTATATITNRVLLPRADRYTVRVAGTSSWPEAHMAARAVVAAEAKVDDSWERTPITRVRMTQLQRPRGYYLPEWTVTLNVRRAFTPSTCPATYRALDLRCERPAGHDGDHTDSTTDRPSTLAWSQAVTDRR